MASPREDVQGGDRGLSTRFLAAFLALLGFTACSSAGESASESVCDRLGTFHRDSRSRLERLRVSERISLSEWECLARELALLDEEFTARCESSQVSFGELRAEQRIVYSDCLDPPRDSVLKEAIGRRLPSR